MRRLQFGIAATQSLGLPQAAERRCRGLGAFFWLLGSAGSGNTYSLWDHQNRADPGLGLVVADTANIPSRPQNMVVAAFLEKDLFFNGLLAKIPTRSSSRKSPVVVFTNTNLKFFFRLWATSTSAAVRAKKYLAKSGFNFFRVDLISKIVILPRCRSTSAKSSRFTSLVVRTMSKAFPYTTMPRLANATARFCFCRAVGTQNPAFLATKMAAALRAVDCPDMNSSAIYNPPCFVPLRAGTPPLNTRSVNNFAKAARSTPMASQKAAVSTKSILLSPVSILLT